jgi:hypothetical protein
MTEIQELNHEIKKRSVQLENKIEEIRLCKMTLAKLESESHSLVCIVKALDFKLKELGK